MMLLLVTIVCILMGVFTSNKTLIMVGFLFGFIALLNITGKGKLGLGGLANLTSKLPKAARTVGGIALALVLIGAVGYFTSGLGNNGSGLFASVLKHGSLVAVICIVLLVILVSIKFISSMKNRRFHDTYSDRHRFNQRHSRYFQEPKGNRRSREESMLEREHLKFERNRLRMEVSQQKRENRQANREIWEANKDANMFKIKIALGIIGGIVALCFLLTVGKGVVNLVVNMSGFTRIIAIVLIAIISFIIFKAKKKLKGVRDLLGSNNSDDYVFQGDSDSEEENDNDDCTEEITDDDSLVNTTDKSISTTQNKEKSTEVPTGVVGGKNNKTKPPEDIDTEQAMKIISDVNNFSASDKPLGKPVTPRERAKPSSAQTRTQASTNRRVASKAADTEKNRQSKLSQERTNTVTTSSKPKETQTERIMRERSGKPTALMQDLFDVVNDNYDVDKDVEEMIAKGKVKRRR